MGSQGKVRVGDDQEVFHELPRKMNDARGAAPRMSAHEADGTFELTVEVPGVPEDAIDISLEGDILSISFEKNDGNEGKRALFSERSYGRFERSIQLPFAPEPERVEATIERGLLTISFPRMARERTHHIAVNGARAESQDDGEGELMTQWADVVPKDSEPLTLDVAATRL